MCEILTETAVPQILKETVVPLVQVPEAFPPDRFGRRPSYGAVWRWATTGRAGPDGQPVKLQVARLGRAWISSREAISRFVERVGGKAPNPEPAPTLNR